MRVLVGRTQVASTTAVFSAFMVFQVYAFLHYDFTLLAIGAGMMLLVVLHGRHHLLKRDLTPERFIILAVLATMTLTLPIALSRTPFATYHYAIGLLSIMAAYVFSRYPRETCRSLGITLFTVQFFTIWYLLTTTHTVFPLDHMIEGSSSNVITSVLVVLQAAYAGVSFHVLRRAPLFTSFATLYICLEGFGRGSILAAAMICAASLVMYVLSIRSTAGRVAVVAAALAVLAYFVPRTIDQLGDYLMSSTKLSQGLMDPARVEMHRDYLSKINPITFFTGTDFSGTSIESKYNGNPHSSLIRAHYLFGIFYLTAILFSLAVATLATRTWLSLFVTAGLTFIILFRSLSEPVLFPTAMDFFVFTFLFISGDHVWRPVYSAQKAPAKMAPSPDIGT